MNNDLTEEAKKADVIYKGLNIARRLGTGHPYSDELPSGRNEGYNYFFSREGMMINANTEKNFEHQKEETCLVNESSTEKIRFKGEVVFERVGDTVKTFRQGEWQKLLEEIYEEAMT